MAQQVGSTSGTAPELDLASNDPLVGYLLSAAGAVDITGLRLQSPGLSALPGMVRSVLQVPGRRRALEP